MSIQFIHVDSRLVENALDNLWVTIRSCDVQRSLTMAAFRAMSAAAFAEKNHSAATVAPFRHHLHAFRHPVQGCLADMELVKTHAVAEQSVDCVEIVFFDGVEQLGSKAAVLAEERPGRYTSS